MSWLHERLKELNFTHNDLQEALAKRGIKRVRATITGWANDKPVSLLNNPKHTKILAEVLQWSVLDMLIAAGYDINVPKELVAFVEAYRHSSERHQSMYIQNLTFIQEFLGNLSEDELDEPESDEDMEED